MKYKVGDRVRIKSIDWYNENKDEDGYIDLRLCSQSHHCLHPDMSVFCGKIVTIISISEHDHAYDIKEDNGEFYWTDEMIEGLVEEETKPNVIEEAKTYWDSIKDAWICPDGYQFVDENSNVINATKIVLEKKKKEYPKTYEECCKVLDIEGRELVFNGEYRASKLYWKQLGKLNFLNKLLICRDAYWKIAGEEMGLGKPWEPNLLDDNQSKFALANWDSRIENRDYSTNRNYVLTFPTEEMRDAFKENFKELIEQCKELL